MELKCIVVAKDAIKKDENLAAFLRDIVSDFITLAWTWKEIESNGCEELFADTGVSPEEALLLCPEDKWVVRGRELGLAVMAYAELGSVYSFPHAEYVMEGIHFLTVRDVIRRYQREKRLPWTIATTERLVIKEEMPSDAERLHEIYQSPSVKHFLEPLFELEKERKYLEDYYKYIYSFFEYGLWHLELKGSGVIIGRAGLTPKTYDDGAHGAELGYVLDEKYQGQGYCMEACREIIRYAIEELELECLYCLIRPDNEHSIRICEKLGFSYEKDMISEGRNMKRFVLKLYS